jgi:hypothetical protein
MLKLSESNLAMFNVEENSRVVFTCPKHNPIALDIEKFVLVPCGF